jgi:hypothetical protein
MLKRLTSEDSIKRAAERLRELIDAHPEWLYVQGVERSVLLQRSECDFRIAQGRLIFYCWNAKGLATMWRINGWEWTEGKLLLDASRRMGAERARLELIPRASVHVATAALSETRRERCSRLAHLACAQSGVLKVERVALSRGLRRHQPGRYARIVLKFLNRERIAVTGEVALAEGRDVDSNLSSALIWFTRLSESVRPPDVRKLWLVAASDYLEALGQRLALLRDELRRVITLYQIDDEWRQLTPVRAPALEELWSEKPQRFRRPAQAEMSESAALIIRCAPEAIDVVGSRRGETLRFRGLPFARVRRVMGREHVWFGIEGARRRRLDESTQAEWSKLLRDLQEHRLSTAADQHHALYRAAPEAWLESELRRDVTRLDPALRLAPLHAQFRPARVGAVSRPIDLLALRLDGRLVVIELKVSEDRQHVLQGADYWRRVEIHRRHGHLAHARLFGDAVIANAPPLVYLVAPTLRFHRSFNLLARAITPEIELYRIDINEDWRARGVRVMRRTRVN